MTSPPQPLLTEDQRQHLEFVQSVITRLATMSATTKGWTLTVATAAFGFSATEAVPVVALLGLVVVLLFASLDIHYLREERLFRELYARAARGEVPVYSMDKSAYKSLCTRRAVVTSWAIFLFYGALFAVGLATFVWSLRGE